MADVYVNYELQRIRCGKPSCRCATPDQSQWHGPYWYAYWNDPKTKKKRSKYIGKNFNPPTGETRTPYSERRPPPRASEWRSERSERRAEREWEEQQRAERERAERERAERERERAERERTARERAQAYSRVRIPQDDLDAATLGVNPGVSQSELKRAWRRMVTEAHPDRYPPNERAQQEEVAKEINAAYQRIMKRRGWT